MRKSTSLLLALFFLFSTQLQAKIWRVNNNPDIAADFTTLQAAHDGASNGDTLHIEGSPNNYGSLTCSKKLIIIGPGYFLAENPNTQALKQTAQVSTIYFNDGSAGSSLLGLDLRNNSINIYSNDIVIRRNNFGYASGNTPDYYTGNIQIYYANNNGNQGASNIIIAQNYGVNIYVSYPSTGVLVTNNYIGADGYAGDQSTSGAFQAAEKAIVLVQNNVFVRGTVTAYNSNFSNNIMVAGTFNGTGNLISNNLANGTQFGTANGNKANVDMSTVFIGAGTDVSPDGQWKLKAGSPAIGAGYGRTTNKKIDAGMYGGNLPYVLSGMPSMPAIYFFENQPVGSNADPIDVTIKVRSAGN